MSQVSLKVCILTSKLIIIAAVLLLLPANASAAIIAVHDASPIAEGQITIRHWDAEDLCAVNAPTTRQCRTAQVCPFATVATQNIPAKNSGVRQNNFFWKAKLNLMSDDYLSDLDKIVIEGDRLKVWKDPVSKQIRYLYEKGIRDDYVAGFIKNKIDKEKRKRAFGGIPFLPPELFFGDFIFGMSLDGKILRIPTSWLNGHIMQLGNTGSGKTNASKVRAIRIAHKVSGCWLVDIRKREYRLLLPIFRQMGIELKIIRGRKFNINPLSVPQGVEPLDYASVISECLVRTLDLPPRSANLLKVTIIKLYAERGVLNGNPEAPTLFDIYHAVKNNRDANSQSRQATMDALYALLVSLGPEVLGYSKGWDIHELARQHLVLELSDLCETGKDLILSYLLTAEFISRIARGISNPGAPNLYIAFDEGQRLFSAKKESAGYGPNPLVDLLGLIRGAGVCCEISVLTTVDLSPVLPVLTATKLVGRTGSISEYIAAGNFIGLNREQVAWAACSLMPGIFIGQVSNGTFRHPFLFRMPLVEDIKLESVNDTEADESSRKVVTSKVIQSRRPWSWKK